MIMNRMEIKRHELFTHVSNQVAKEALDFGLPEETASQLGCNVANAIAELFGGQNLTFPKDYAFKISQRDAQIYHEFKGNNYHELSQKYRMTERGIRKVITRVKQKITTPLAQKDAQNA